MHALTIDRNTTWASNACIVLLSSLFLGLLGHLSIPLPFTPVPLVVQNQACLFLGALLGARRGAAAVALFLAQGALGWPVLAGGAGGLAVLVGSDGGYFVGYLVGAYLVGAILERVKRTPWNSFWALLAGSGVTLAFGSAHLALFVGAWPAIVLGVAPFIVGDVLKNLACVQLLRRMS